MATRPELSPGVPNYYEWASETSQEVVRVGSKVLVLPNKDPVLPEFETFGLKHGQPPTRQEINEQFYGMSLWIQYQDQLLAVGSLKRTTSTETDVEISARLGGTWTLLDTEILGGKNVNIWEKIS